ncbi:MAG: hypothetical protein K1X91_13815 [Bacteriodetes bacterium]|nr:hypothetical protein [Bacteroidota bacterium]
MKLVILFSAIAFTFFNASATHAQSGCDLSNDCIWSMWISGQDTLSISYNGYGPCKVVFLYKIRYCGFKYEIFPTYYQFIDVGNQPCKDLNDYMEWLRANDINTYWTATQDIITLCTKAEMVSYFEKQVKRFNACVSCSQPSPSCSSSCQPNGLVSVTAVFAKCVEIISVGSLISADCQPVAFMIPCSMEGCCKITRTMCYDYNTEVTRVCETISQVPGAVPCSGFSDFTNPLECPILGRSGCMLFSCPAY